MSNASEPKHCPKCQTPLPADAPQGLCPKCLLAAASIPTDAGQPAPDKTPPSLAELAAAFPQLEILELIGHGGMGFVFKARQPKLDRFVALKILPQSLAADPAFAERFSREGRVLARLNHPNIVTVHDFGIATGREDLPVRQDNEAAQQHRPTPQFYYLLMEYVDGVNLRQAMRAGRFTPDQALAIVPKICEALQFAHNEGILHRDIKPENILLDAKGRVKIADFGIAKLMERGSVTRSASKVSNASGSTEDSLAGGAAAGRRPALHALTEAGKALGTPNYMAPEQRECSGEVDHRADIYSLGVVFYEMLTGELPLGRFAPPSQKSAADPRVDEVVLRALEKEKAKRYASADEVRTQVETITATPDSGRRRGDESQTESERRKAESGKPGESLVTSAATQYNPREIYIVVGATIFLAVMAFVLLGVALEYPRQATAPLMVMGMCVIGLSVCGLSLAGLWPFPGRRFPEPAFSSRNLRRRRQESGLSKSETEPRFSPTALFGAVLGATFVMTGVPFYFMLRVFPGIVMLLLAACGMTLCGWIAVSQIRRSAGKLYGLWLAVFDGLLFPLLALDGLIFIAVGLGLWVAGLGWKRTSPPTVPLSYLLFVAVLLGILLLLDFLIIRRVWRAVNKPLDYTTSSSRHEEAQTEESESGKHKAETAPKSSFPANRQNNGYGKWAFGLFLLGTLGVFLLALVFPQVEKSPGAAFSFGGFAILLALALGIMGWRERLGKFTVIATGIVFVIAGVVILFVLQAGENKARQLQQIAQDQMEHARQGFERHQSESLRAGLTFGPVIERVVEDVAAPDYKWFDLDTGAAIPTDGVVANDAEDEAADALFRRKGLDIGACMSVEKPLLIARGGGFAAVPVLQTLWDSISAGALTEMISVARADEKAIPLVTNDNLPATYAFRTREGGMGILQITGFTENPRGVKIRYKLVQNADSAKAFKPIPLEAVRLWNEREEWFKAMEMQFMEMGKQGKTNNAAAYKALDQEYNDRGKVIGDMVHGTKVESLTHQQEIVAERWRLATENKDTVTAKDASEEISLLRAQIEELFRIAARER